MSYAGDPVRKFVSSKGEIRYSIRKREDGFFQIVHDGSRLPDGSQPYWMEDRVVSGIFATADLAEKQLLCRAPDAWIKV